MKLITEHTEDGIVCITEDTGVEKQRWIQGIFMQAEQKNKNRRIYPRKILEKAVGDYVRDYVNTNRSGGELNHPSGPVVNPERISHRITELRWEGDNVFGKALVLDTPMGRIVKGLIDGGIKLGVSSRGMGNIENRGGQSYVKDDFRLATVDVVYDPSAPSAFVEGIMEGVEWVWDNGSLVEQKLEQIETEIKKTSSRNLTEAKIKAFDDFLSAIKS